MSAKYELTLSSFPQVVVLQADSNIMAYPTPSGPAVLVFRNDEEATAFIDVLSSTGKVTGPCKIVNVGVRGWLSFGESLGVKHVAIVVANQDGGQKIGIVPLAELLAAAREYAAGHSVRGQDGEGQG